MIYPLKFIPIYKNIIWGGRNIEKKFNRHIPAGKVAESWEICCRKEGISVVASGIYKGMNLYDLINKYKEKLLGSEVYSSFSNNFPFILKIIDANDKLSVQVHPGDDYKELEDGESRKTEMWYIIDAKPGAQIVYGLKDGVTKEEFADAVKSKDIKRTLNFVNVKKGDYFYIPGGTVHAILDGILIAEIQQNSNTTYRVYDWDRVDDRGNSRELHITKALNAISFNNADELTRLEKPLPVHKCSDFSSRELVTSKHFTVKEIDIKGKYHDTADGTKFFMYMNLEGSGTIRYSGGEEEVNPGDTILIPATLGEYNLNGNIKVLKMHV